MATDEIKLKFEGNISIKNNLNYFILKAVICTNKLTESKIDIGNSFQLEFINFENEENFSDDIFVGKFLMNVRGGRVNKDSFSAIIYRDIGLCSDCIIDETDPLKSFRDNKIYKLYKL